MQILGRIKIGEQGNGGREIKVQHTIKSPKGAQAQFEKRRHRPECVRKGILATRIVRRTVTDEPWPDRPHVRSEPLLADALDALRALMAELENYTIVHGADEDDEHALALGREIMRKANAGLDGRRTKEDGRE